MSIYEKLNDKEWLFDQYEKKKRSCLNISKEIGCNNNSVRQALIKYGISIRNPSQAQIVSSDTNLTIDRSVLDGSLMGDASLVKWKKSAKSLPHLSKKNKNFDHLKLFANSFEDNPNIKLEELYLKATQKTYPQYAYRSKVDPQLQEYYERWYPESNNYVKVIPDDIEVDSTFLLHWFLDDGYSHLRDRTNEYAKIGKGWTTKTDQIRVGFCTECFELEQQKVLCDKINDKFDLSINPHKIVWKNSKESKEGYRLQIPQLNSNKFFEIIGDCPIESLKYKWKITNH